MKKAVLFLFLTISYNTLLAQEYNPFENFYTNINHIVETMPVEQDKVVNKGASPKKTKVKKVNRCKTSAVAARKKR